MVTEMMLSLIDCNMLQAGVHTTPTTPRPTWQPRPRWVCASLTWTCSLTDWTRRSASWRAAQHRRPPPVLRSWQWVDDARLAVAPSTAKPATLLAPHSPPARTVSASDDRQPPVRNAKLIFCSLRYRPLFFMFMPGTEKGIVNSTFFPMRFLRIVFIQYSVKYTDDLWSDLSFVEQLKHLRVKIGFGLVM